MPSALTAVSGLLPLTGVVFLLVRAARRAAANRSAPRAPAHEMQWPKEPPALAAQSRRGPPPVADAHCADCGTSIPGTDTLCAWCALRAAGPISAQERRSVVLSWIVTIAVLGTIFGVGALLAY